MEAKQTIQDVEAGLEEIERSNIKAGDEVLRVSYESNADEFQVVQRGVAKNEPSKIGQIDLEDGGTLGPDGTETWFYKVQE
jgi:hypothetical protein